MFSNESWATTVDVQVGDASGDEEDLVFQKAILQSVTAGVDQVMREGRRRVVIGVVNGKLVPSTANELAPISRLIY